jgi:hypothetical protein
MISGVLNRDYKQRKVWKTRRKVWKTRTDVWKTWKPGFSKFARSIQ